MWRVTYNATTDTLLLVHEGEETAMSRIVYVSLEQSANAWREVQPVNTEMGLGWPQICGQLAQSIRKIWRRETAPVRRE